MEEGDDGRDVEVEDEGDDSLEEGDDDREEVDNNVADEPEDGREEEADEAADVAEDLEEDLVDRLARDLEDRTESLEDDLRISHRTQQGDCGWSEAGRLTMTTPATRWPSSLTVIWAVPSTERRMTSMGWPTSAWSEVTAPVRIVLTSPRGTETTSSVQFAAVTNSVRIA